MSLEMSLGPRGNVMNPKVKQLNTDVLFMYAMLSLPHAMSATTMCYSCTYALPATCIGNNDVLFLCVLSLPRAMTAESINRREASCGRPESELVE